MKKNVLFVFVLFSLFSISALSVHASRTMCEDYSSGKQLGFEIRPFKSGGKLTINVWSYLENASMSIEKITINGKSYKFSTSSGMRFLYPGQNLTVTIHGWGYTTAPSPDSVTIHATRCAVVQD